MTETPIQTPRRALIVIDVQNEYVTGALRIEYPPVEESLGNIGMAMDAAHAARPGHRGPADGAGRRTAVRDWFTRMGAT